jgi:hypothetical protein
MSRNDEGAIKFTCDWTDGPAPEGELVAELLSARDRLRGAGLIGVGSDGIGFGNVSVRLDDGDILITGSQTGAIDTLSAAQLTRIVWYDIARNRVVCVGPVKASSESLTHAAIYECSEAIGAVVHVHARDEWERLRAVLPTTEESVAYGTPDMAREIARLYRESELPMTGIAVMGGHRDGIIAFADDVGAAVEIVMERLR